MTASNDNRSKSVRNQVEMRPTKTSSVGESLDANHGPADSNLSENSSRFELIDRLRHRIALADEQSADMMPVRVADAKALIRALEAAELRAIEAIDERDTIAARHLELARRANTQRMPECARCGGTVVGGGCLECGEVS